MGKTAEEKRLEDNAAHRVFWKKWGPYLSERQWGTVREDYSKDGDAWDYFPHDHARSRVYRWGEDGIAGISDIHQNICFSIALWNGNDPVLKERLFGLNNAEGNHGEDVKELYYYLDNTPTHSYMKYLYKYPRVKFPYRQLIETNRNRSRFDPEFELLDTGIFDGNRYFDVFIEYAKNTPDDVLVRIEVCNRGTDAAGLTLLPTLWFRNTWLYGKVSQRPGIRFVRIDGDVRIIEAVHEESGTYYLLCEDPDTVLFTENETNLERTFHKPNPTPFVKDAFHDAIVQNNTSLLENRSHGTKCAAVYRLEIPGESSEVIRLRLRSRAETADMFGKSFDSIFDKRIAESDAFYEKFKPEDPVSDVIRVQRQAFAGLLWNKQYYNYELETWMNGDRGLPSPPSKRKYGRNHDWHYLFNRDIISMPDKWEFPWYAVWDLAFHCVVLAMIDPDYAKKQIILFTREWYMRPNGQLPAYEWNLDDVNPPVHAWAAMKVYRTEKKFSGGSDITFLKRIFHKLLLNFTWWVNRKDSEGRNIFQGGFLGLDNVGLFDRSSQIPYGGHIEQADGTSWMAMYALNMMDMALEIAKFDTAYEDVASKFFEHFVHIAESLNQLNGFGLWHEEDGFYYDVLHLPDGGTTPLRVRSLVGLTPLFAVSVINRDLFERLKGFRKRLLWFRNHRLDLDKYIAIEEIEEGRDILLSLTPKQRLTRVLSRMLDENEFLSPGGIRSISKYHESRPFTMNINGNHYRVDYEPGESSTGLFGGNSNWRGPVWIQMNYLFIESLANYYDYYGDTYTIEFPTGSGNYLNLWETAKAISKRITGLFIQNENGGRAVHGDAGKYRDDPYFRDLVLFYEYYHGDTGRGLGASHQTGWSSLVAEMIHWCWCG